MSPVGICPESGTLGVFGMEPPSLKKIIPSTVTPPRLRHGWYIIGSPMSQLGGHGCDDFVWGFGFENWGTTEFKSELTFFEF